MPCISAWWSQPKNIQKSRQGHERYSVQERESVKGLYVGHAAAMHTMISTVNSSWSDQKYTCRSKTYRDTMRHMRQCTQAHVFTHKNTHNKRYKLLMQHSNDAREWERSTKEWKQSTQSTEDHSRPSPNKAQRNGSHKTVSHHRKNGSLKHELNWRRYRTHAWKDDARGQSSTPKLQPDPLFQSVKSCYLCRHNHWSSSACLKQSKLTFPCQAKRVCYDINS